MNTYEKIDAVQKAITTNQRSLVASITRRSIWLGLRAIDAVPAHLRDPIALCLDRHRLPSAKIPCVECLKDAQ